MMKVTAVRMSVIDMRMTAMAITQGTDQQDGGKSGPSRNEGEGEV